MSKFVKSSVWSIGANFFVRALSIVTYPFLVRYFLRSDISIFKSLQSFIFILVTVIPFGTNYLYISSTKENRLNRWNLVILVSIISTLILVFLFMFDKRIVNFFIRNEINSFLASLILILPFLSLVKSIALTQLTSNMDFKEISLALIIKQILLYSLIICVSLTNAKFSLLITILIFTEICEGLLLILFCYKQKLKIFPIKGKKVFPIDKISKKFLLFSGLDQIFIVLALQFPTIFVVIVMGPVLAPEFQLALYAINIPASLIAYQVSRVIFPYLSEKRDDEKMRNTLLRIEFIISILLIPILFTISFFSKEIVSLVFDKSWSNAMLAFTFLPIMVLASAINNPFSTIAEVKEKPYIQLAYSVCLLGGRILSIYIGFKLAGFIGALLLFISIDVLVRSLRLMIDIYLIKMKIIDFIKNIRYTLLYGLLLVSFSQLLMLMSNRKVVVFILSFLISSSIVFVIEKKRIFDNIKVIFQSFKNVSSI